MADCAQHEAILTTHSAAETQCLGARVAAHLRPGDMVRLYGELGAGKTTFIQGMAQGLEVEDYVTSPSFTIIHAHEGRFPLYHLDLYRLGPGDLDDIGIEEVIGSHSVVAVEWAERLPSELQGDGLEVEMGFTEREEQMRRIRLRGHGERLAAAVAALAGELDARAGS